jgi:chromosomal replication initiator protein
VQLLICEDLQALEGREESQQQLLAAIDDVLAHGGLVLLTSTRMPGAIKHLNRRLVNRVHGGLCVSMDLPGPQSRRKLIERFLACESTPLSAAEIDRIAEQHPGSPRELWGLLQQLRAEALEAVPGSTSRDARLSALLKERATAAEVSLKEIARATAGRFGVKISDLKGPRRSQTVSLARQTAMYLARELAGLNYAEIGEFFNRGNHSTVIHACRKISALLPVNVSLEQEVRGLWEELGGRRRRAVAGKSKR